MGSFRPVAGNLHLHKYYNFTGRNVETVPKSLRHSFGVVLTCIGISLNSDRYTSRRRLLGLKFTASLALTDPRDLPAPGRRQPPYIILRFCGDLCFW